MAVPAVTKLQALEEFNRALTTPLSASELVELAVGKARLGTGADAAEIFLAEESSGQSFLVCHRGLYPEAFQQITRFFPGEGYPGLVIANRELIVTDRLSEDDRYLRIKVKEAGFLSYLCLPLFLKEKVVGCLNIASRSTEKIRRDDRQFLESIASGLSLALEARRWQLAEVLTRRESSDGIKVTSKEVAGSILEAVATNCHSEGASLWFIAASGNTYRLLATWGIAKSTYLPQSRLPAKCPALVSPRFSSCSIARCPFKVGANICYPLSYQSRTIGVISLTYGEGNSLPTEIFSLLPGAAILSALTLGQVRRDLAGLAGVAETEGQRLLREIHDGVLQSLGLLRVKADYINQLKEHEPKKLVGELKELRYLAGDALEELRRVIYASPPKELEPGELVSSVRHLARQLAQAYHIPVAVRVENGVKAMTPPAEQIMFRFAQEALSNALRHSGAKQIELELKLDSSGFRLLVKDAGHGFKPEETGWGMGLLSMKERANSLGGKLTINSAIGQGTIVQMWLP